MSRPRKSARSAPGLLDLLDERSQSERSERAAPTAPPAEYSKSEWQWPTGNRCSECNAFVVRGFARTDGSDPLCKSCAKKRRK